MPYQQPLHVQWKYLSCMGGAADAEMFAEAWKNTRITRDDFPFAPDVLDKLPLSLRRAVVRAVVEQVRKDAGNLTEVLKTYGNGRKDQPDPRDHVISMLEKHPQSDPKFEAEELFADLQKGPAPSRRALFDNVPLWLAHTQPDSPLVAMLAKADKPALRRMAIGGLEGCPTPENQDLLAALRKDPDAAMRAEADKAWQQLQRLAAQNPAEFASAASSVPSRSSTSPNSMEKN